MSQPRYAVAMSQPRRNVPMSLNANQLHEVMPSSDRVYNEYRGAMLVLGPTAGIVTVSARVVKKGSGRIGKVGERIYVPADMLRPVTRQRRC